MDIGARLLAVMTVAALAAPTGAPADGLPGWPADVLRMRIAPDGPPLGRPGSARDAGDGPGSAALLCPNGARNFASISGSAPGDGVTVRQNGRGHRIHGTVAGTGNLASVIQSGVRQQAGFVQTGTANRLLIRQSAW